MPKWKNKGHEFDELGNLFIKNNKLVLVGCKQFLEEKKIRLEFLNITAEYIKIPSYMNNSQKGIKKFFNKLRISFFKQKLCKKLNKNITLVIENNLFYQFKNKLEKKGFKSYVRFFPSIEFFIWYLGTYCVYVKNMTYANNACNIITTFCNLNCKSCLNFNPYIKEKEHRDLNLLKSDTDYYFRAFDKVGLYQLSGGEPQLYPHLKEIIEYISLNYRKQIDILTFVTNAIITPSDEFCVFLKKHDVTVEIDNYSHHLPNLKNCYQKTIEQLNKHNVKTIIYNAGEVWNWFEAFPTRGRVLKDEECNALRQKYLSCTQPHMNTYKGRLYSCNYAQFADNAEICKCHESDSYDLTTFSPDKKKELNEFRLNYNERGYVEFCKYCNGYNTINKVLVPPAVQVKGILNKDEELNKCQNCQ